MYHICGESWRRRQDSWWGSERARRRRSLRMVWRRQLILTLKEMVIMDK
jgi:hypothetical protein